MAGVSYNQPEQEYRRDPAHAQSHVKHILKSPAHYQAALKQPWSPTLTMHVGSAVHCLVLEGQREFDSRFVLKPEGLSLTTKAGKEWKVEQKNKTVLSTSDQHRSWHAVHGMAASVRRLPWFAPEQRDYYRHNEVSIYFDAGGLSCKCRIDRLLLFPDQAVVVDLKSTESVTPSAFTKTIFGDLNYLFQAAWYTEAVQQLYGVPADFVFAAVERKAPYNCRVFELSAEAMREGFRQTAAARSKLLECQQSDLWELPPVEAHPLELPAWYRSPLEDEPPDGPQQEGGGYTDSEDPF